jgi:hypothetical protein
MDDKNMVLMDWESAREMWTRHCKVHRCYPGKCEGRTAIMRLVLALVDLGMGLEVTSGRDHSHHGLDADPARGRDEDHRASILPGGRESGDQVHGHRGSPQELLPRERREDWR